LALVVMLAVGAFVLSYDALRALAEEHGVRPELSWIWPLTVDGFLFVASLAVVRNGLLGERTAYQWALVAVFTGVSVAFNVLHSGAGWLARLVGALPPIALVLAFELAMSQLKSELQRRSLASTLDEMAQEEARREQDLAALETRVERAQRRLAAINDELTTLRREKRILKRASTANGGSIEGARASRKEQAEQALARLLAFYSARPDATHAEAGGEVGRSRQWVGARLSELEERGAIERGADGSVVVLDAPTGAPGKPPVGGPVMAVNAAIVPGGGNGASDGVK
jgi:hypothetical protein